MATKEIERKYALMKLESGDWLLPGNDGKTVWRIRREQVPQWDCEGNFGNPERDRWSWQIYKCLVPVEELDALFLDPWGQPDWSIWEGYGGDDTRAGAIDLALMET